MRFLGVAAGCGSRRRGTQPLMITRSMAGESDDHTFSAETPQKRRRRRKDEFDGGEIVDGKGDGYWESVREDLEEEAKKLGLGPTGVTTADPSARIAQYEDWIAKGYNGEMGFLGRDDRLLRRKDLGQILPEVLPIPALTLRSLDSGSDLAQNRRHG
jgi:hypothetical protein